MTARPLVPPAGEQVSAVLEASIPPFDPAGSAADWTVRAQLIRTRAMEQVFRKGLPAAPRPPRVEWGPIHEVCTDYRIRTLRYEVLPDYWVPALLYEPIGWPSPRPAVLNADGHHDAGNAAESKQIRSANLARRGVTVLSYEFVGMGELGADADLDPTFGATLHFNLSTHELVGIGAPALMYAVMSGALDILIAQPSVDPARVVMTGLSGGGWQTIVLAAMDERVTGAVPVAGYTSIAARVGSDEDVGDLEQVPADMALICDYQLLTAMLAPRPALVICNEFDDCCFATERAKPVVYDALRPVYEAFGAGESFEFHSNREPGDHNYGPDNRSRLYRFLGTHFGVAGAPGDCHEPAEILAEHELRVGLPVSQRTVRDIARERARMLRAGRRERFADDPEARRQALRAVLRVPELVVEPVDDVRFAAPGDRTVVALQLGRWTLPATWTGAGDDAAIELVIADEPPTAPASRDGVACCAVDVTGVGSTRISALQTELLSAAGHRLLGVIVGQVLALRKLFGGRSVDVVAVGIVPAVAGLLSAALQPSSFRTVIAERCPITSLEDLIDRGVRYAEAAALFCPELLTVIDLDEAITLVGDTSWRPIGRSGSSDPK